MVLRLLPSLALAATFLAAASPLASQTVYDAEKGKLGLSLGAGISNFDPDFAQGLPPGNEIHEGWGQGRMSGTTVWADAGIPWGVRWLRGFSIEAEYRTILEGGSTGQSNLRESNLAGGATYTWRRWDRVRPYGKYLFGYGEVSFAPVPEANGTAYSQDSRGMNILGGGAEVRCTRHIWARAEYDYESWGQLLGPHLQPQGFTVGAMYHLRSIFRH
jgi:opacity protein-like surface antigen